MKSSDLLEQEEANKERVVKDGDAGEKGVVRKMDPRPIYFGFWCLMTNTTKLD